jgi:hypothetical protein
MRRRSFWTAVLAAVLTAMVVAGFALAGDGRNAAPKDPRGSAATIVLIDRETDDLVFTDLGDPGEGAGDTVVRRDDLFDAKSAKKVGNTFIRCTIQFGSPPVSQCDVVARLDGRGDIILSGLVSLPDVPFTLAVTGGTGEFRHARGQALVKTADLGPPLTRHVTLELRGVR